MSYAMVAMAAATAISAGVSYYNGQQQVQAQTKAADEAKKRALSQDKLAEQADNKANAKRPDTMALLSAAGQAGRGGASGSAVSRAWVRFT